MTVDKFFSMLFKPEEHTCSSKDKFGNTVHQAHERRYYDVYFSVNALHPGTTRCDDNVASFRNFVIEFDSIPIQQQWELVRDLDMPFTTSVFSGKKSIHFVISLESPLTDRESYDNWFYAISQALSFRNDPACKNPSRFTRYPEAMRHDTGRVQKLLEVRKQVSNAALAMWIKLNGGDPFPPKKKEYRKKWDGPRTTLRRKTHEFLLQGCPDGERNNTVFSAACDFASCGFTQRECESMIMAVTGLCKGGTEEREFKGAISSAYKRMTNKNNKD